MLSHARAHFSQASFSLVHFHGTRCKWCIADALCISSLTIKYNCLMLRSRAMKENAAML